MSKIEWVSPPAAKRGKTANKWANICNEVKQNPNQWAKIGTVKHASQSTILAKAHDLKIVCRKNDDGLYDLYAIYEVANEG